MSDIEQNKRINQLKRQLTAAVERIKTLELDVEPQGRISEAFSVLEKHIDDRFTGIESRLDTMDARFDRLEHRFNQLQAKLEVICKAHLLPPAKRGKK